MIFDLEGKRKKAPTVKVNANAQNNVLPEENSFEEDEDVYGDEENF